MDKRIFKKSEEELQAYLAFKRHGFLKPMKKGRGSKYNRQESRKDAFEMEERSEDN